MDDLFRLDGKVAVVTGGANGLGKAAAEMLASAGAKVAVLDKAESAGAHLALVADVTDEASLESAFASVVDRLGRVDILVNNAGIVSRGPAVEVKREDWDRVVGINLTGMFLSARIAARHMIAAGQGGAIVNTASIMGLSGGLTPNIAYQTTKGGVVNMTRALALEWVDQRIRVNAVAPAYVRTALTAAFLDRSGIMEMIEAATPMKRLVEPEEVAAAILFLASPAASAITGTILPVDGGYLAR
jgi:NAD(P)-dependent dehydrogenase (short-subunit alcohol dehydrogenase family)